MCVCHCSALLSSCLLNTIGAAQAHQKQPWRSHSNAVSRHWVAKQHRTTCAAATPSAATPTRFCKEAYKVNVPVLTQCGQCLEISSGEDKPTLCLWFKDKHYEWLTGGCRRWSWFLGPGPDWSLKLLSLNVSSFCQHQSEVLLEASKLQAEGNLVSRIQCYPARTSRFVRQLAQVRMAPSWVSRKFLGISFDSICIVVVFVFS